jgi:hypothetical protein
VLSRRLDYKDFGERRLLKRIFSGIMLTVLLMAMLHSILNVKPVGGWSNGGFSTDPAHPTYGTHDWIAQHALDWLPPAEKQYISDNLANYLYGTELPDNSGAPDGIGDTALHHIYYQSTGSLQDDASAIRAQAEYNEALNYIKSGDVATAVKTLGIMSHYISDVTVFGHVMATGTDWGPEVHHSDYEDYVNQKTSNYADEFNTYLVFDGGLDLVSAYDAACELAYDTTFDVHGDSTCVWMDQNYNWNNAVFKDRAGEALNLGVNYLADVLHTFLANVTIYVAPSLVEYWTPNYGTAFTVGVEIANAENLYGFEFKLNWNSTLLDLTKVDITPPSAWETNYFAGMNDTREDLGRYWLAVAALNPAPSFNGSATLVKLTFKITYDPIYPNNVTSSLDLVETELSDPESNSITHDTYDGEYLCYATRPRLEVEPSTYTATTLGEEFTINITVADIVNLYSFEFQLSYNTSLLDARRFTVGPFFNPPYRITKQIIDDAAGLIWLSVESQAPAPSTNGSGTLATIAFIVPMECDVWYQGCVPLECDLHFDLSILKTDQGVTVPHDITDPLLHYVYMPIPGDLDSNAIVNVFDLRIVARAFGSTTGEPNWDLRADLTRDGKINVRDLVLVARNYGRTIP